LDPAGLLLPVGKEGAPQAPLVFYYDKASGTPKGAIRDNLL
jgi:hypothetical protein